MAPSREAIPRGGIAMADPDSHPLLTKRMGGALTVLVAGTGIGLTLMSYSPLVLRAIGMLMAVLGAVGAAWIYWGDFRQLRLRLVHGNDTTQPLYAEQWIILIAVLVAILIPAYVWLDESWPTLPPDTSRHLREDQQTRMRSKLQLSNNESYSIQINSAPNCDECEVYAQEFRDFVGSIPGWNAGGGVVSYWDPHETPGGLQLFPSEKGHPEASKIMLSAFAVAGIPISERAPKVFQDLDAIIVVGRRPK